MARPVIAKIHPITQKALEEYVKRIFERERDNLMKIILFGSVARGEATADSDIDVLIILKDKTMQNFIDICGIGADIECEMDFDENAYLQPITISEQEANGLEFFELMDNVEREGVMLYDSQ